MMGSLKTVTLGNPLLKGFKSRILELNDLSATEADEVVMVGSIGSRFVSRFPILKFSSSGQTKPGQKLEGAVHGNIADFRVGFSNLGINLCETLVPGGVQKGVEDLFPLLCCLQPFLGDPCFKEVSFYEWSSLF